jgi:hypothetical protein
VARAGGGGVDILADAPMLIKDAEWQASRSANSDTCPRPTAGRADLVAEGDEPGDDARHGRGHDLGRAVAGQVAAAGQEAADVLQQEVRRLAAAERRRRGERSARGGRQGVRPIRRGAPWGGRLGGRGGGGRDLEQTWSCSRSSKN